MTNRIIVYPASMVQDTDLLNIQTNAMIALGYLAQAAIGGNTAVDGLACTPGTGLNVVVAPGSIFNLTTVDATAYGSLPPNPAPLVKVGVNLTNTTIPVTAPVTPGYSINYLVEAKLAEVDGTPVALPYYNATNPTQTYSGPNNTGLPQNTLRSQGVSVTVKAGTPASTGSQTTPAPDTGYVGLYVVTVAYGAATIAGGNIVLYSGAPFIMNKVGNNANATYTGSVSAGTFTATLHQGVTGSFSGVVSAASGSFSSGVAASRFTGFVTGGLINVQTLTGTGTYTATSGTNSVIVEGGGGGGGGGSSATCAAAYAAAGSGGGEGAYGLTRIIPAPTGTTYTAGTAGAAATAGGATTFGTYLSLPGGTAGITGVTTTVAAINNGGANTAAATASGGNPLLLCAGAGGGNAIIFAGGTVAMSGTGSSSEFGTGGTGVKATAGGVVGSGYSAGGSGATTLASGTAQTGGAGTAGVLYVYEYS